MKLNFSSSATKVRGAKGGEIFNASFTPSVGYSGGASTTTVVVKDSNFLNSASQTVYNNGFITVFSGADDIKNNIKRPYKLTNLTPTIAQLSGDSLINLAGGTSNILIDDGITKKILQCQTSTVIGGLTSVWQSYITGSLALSVYNGVTGRIGSTVSTPTNTQLTVSGGTARNTNLWCHDVYLNAFSIPSPTRPLRGCTLISPNHAVSCNHWAPFVGGEFAWIDDTGAVITRTIASEMQVGASDIQILHFTTPITTITPAKTLPADYVLRLPSLGYGMLACYIDDLRDGGTDASVGVFKINAINFTDYAGNDHEYSGTPSTDATLATYGNLFPYSSGSPEFLIYGTTPILLSTTFRGDHVVNVNSILIAPLLCYSLTEINAAMTALHGSGAYTLGTVDISAATVY
jgi:hypothetical protein